MHYSLESGLLVRFKRPGLFLFEEFAAVSIASLWANSNPSLSFCSLLSSALTNFQCSNPFRTFAQKLISLSIGLFLSVNPSSPFNVVPCFVSTALIPFEWFGFSSNAEVSF